ncbi:hypothetical protein GCM10029964_054370 [Kibdelosporangium lantanae]
MAPAAGPGPLPAGFFDVRTRYSGVSAGTELSFLNGTNPMLHRRWDPDLRLFQPGRSTVEPRLGYMEVGEVTASRSTVAEGAVVAMAYGHRTAHRAGADRFVVLPESFDPLLGIYVAHMGPICLNGVLHAKDVSGRKVAVVGGGVVALLTSLFARHYRAAEVVVVDSTPERRAVATGLGFEAVSPAEAVDLKARWRPGADVVFQCRANAAALSLALRLLRPRGTVVDLAFHQGGAAELRLGEEFHHNGLTIRCAQIGHLPAGWDRAGLSAATISLLRHEGQAIRQWMITDVVSAADAPTLFDDLVHRRRHVTQAVIRMS